MEFVSFVSTYPKDTDDNYRRRRIAMMGFGNASQVNSLLMRDLILNRRRVGRVWYSAGQGFGTPPNYRRS